MKGNEKTSELSPKVYLVMGLASTPLAALFGFLAFTTFSLVAGFLCIFLMTFFLLLSMGCLNVYRETMPEKSISCMEEATQSIEPCMKNEVCAVISPDQQHKCILDSAWDTAKSFVSGLIWIFIVWGIIVFIFG